jgi:hypothetical protein
LTQSQANAAILGFSYTCREYNGLLEEWTKALDRFIKLRHQLCGKAPLSMEELGALQLQLNDAHAQTRNSWQLLEQHRLQHGCSRGTSTKNAPVAPFSREAQPSATSFVVSDHTSSPTHSLNRRESAGRRRDHELQQLAAEGIPLVFHGRWHASIGPLHIWPHSGRWSNEVTQRGGRINSLSMRTLIGRELLENQSVTPKATFCKPLNYQ